MIIAVAILFYLHFSSGKTATADVTANGSDTGAVKTSPAVQKALKEGRIYFINVDSLNERYDMMKDMMKSLQGKEASLQAEYENAGQKYETEGMNYQKRLNDNTITVEEARQVEASLKKQEQHIMDIKTRMNKLQDEAAGHQETLQKEIDAYMKDYGKGKNIDYVLGYSNMIRTVFYANDSLDVTSEVLAGLNARYKENKNKTNNTPKK